MSFYLVPMVGTGTDADPRRPKYVTTLGVNFKIVDFDNAAIVWCNATPAQDAVIAANPDVAVVPPLDSQINVAQTQTALESLNLPGRWLTSEMTYREVLRVLIGMAQLIQKTEALRSKLTLPGRLDMTVAAIPAGIRSALTDACDELRIDRSGITGSTTVREALRIFGQQFVSRRNVELGDL